jgi:hypothetical protein
MAANDAIEDFRGRYVGSLGIAAAEVTDYDGTPAIVARVLDAGTFDREELPAAFRGYAVLIDDGTHVVEARGPLV